MIKKYKHKIVIGCEILLLCMMIGVLGTKAASSNPPSNGVSYNKNSQAIVEGALNDLYNKANYGDAKASDILKGKKALVGGKEVVGTFTCPTLASQTPGNAMDNEIKKGKIAWVNGKKITGTRMDLSSVAKSGNYVKYTSDMVSYTLKGSTKIKGTQMLFPQKANLWIVIGLDSNGRIEITPARVSEPFSFTDEAWPDYVKTLNEIAQIYANKNLSVQVRAMGSKDIYANEKSSMDFSGGVGIHPDTFTPDFVKEYNRIKKLIGDTTVKDTDGLTTSYWVAGKSIKSGTASNSYQDKPCMLAVHNNGSYYCELSGHVLPMRPVVTLFKDVMVYGGTGTESDPFSIG